MTVQGGFSHVGVSTHDMERTAQFYEQVLGCRRVVDERTVIEGGGVLRQVYFDVGDGQFIVFMEPKNVPGISATYDVSINAALGLPAGMYHFALRVHSLEDLEVKRRTLEERGADPSPIIDLGAAKSVFFSDPNGIQLEYCCATRPFDDSDLHRKTDARIAS